MARLKFVFLLKRNIGNHITMDLNYCAVCLTSDDDNNDDDGNEYNDDDADGGGADFLAKQRTLSPTKSHGEYYWSCLGTSTRGGKGFRPVFRVRDWR